MLGLIYVSDPTVWRTFNENMIKGKLIQDSIEAGGEREVASLEFMLKTLFDP